MIRYSVSKVDTLLPLLSSLQISSRTYIKKDKWGYNYVPKDRTVMWRKEAPKPEVEDVPPPPSISRHSKAMFLERLKVDRKQLGKLFERPSLVTAVAPINYETGMLRTGLIGVKQGETNLFLRNGKEEVGTMISIFPNYVLSAKPYYGNRDGILSERKEFLQTVASVDVDQVDELSLPYQKYFYAAGVAPKKFIREFVVTEENILPVGYQLDASHLFAGQYVDVTAKTIDRGFQGVIRRWGYKGQGHCAGRTKTHRRPGSIGTQGLRKVMKGKNLPGWMGNKLRTHLAYKVMYANYERGYIIVNGTTPGPVGGEVFLEDCKVKSSLQAEYLHYPTFLLEGKLLKEHYDGVIVSPNEPTAGLLK